MGEGCGPFREKQACRFSVNILFVVCLFLSQADPGPPRRPQDTRRSLRATTSHPQGRPEKTQRAATRTPDATRAD